MFSVTPVRARALAVLVAGLTTGATFAANEHFLPGGFNGLQRERVGLTATSTIGGSAAVAIPGVDKVYFVPFTAPYFDESQGARYSMSGDGTLTILKSGLYQINANVDWPAQSRGSGQSGYDVDYRKVMVKRVQVNGTPPVYTPGQLTYIPPSSKGWDDLTAHDTPGSDAPRYARGQFTWKPGPIAAGTTVTTDVAVGGGAFTPVAGDLAQAGLSSLNDTTLPGDVNGLRISASVVGSGAVRVSLENRTDHSVTVPLGNLNVVASSSVLSAGNSVDAWMYATSPPVYLLAGEKIFLAVRTGVPGDFIQVSTFTFVQIMNIVP